MSSFIDIVLSFYAGLFQTELFLYFLAGFAFLAAVLAILRIARGFA